MNNPKLQNSIKQLYKLFNNEIIKSLKNINGYYDGIYEISDLIVKDLVSEDNIEEYLKGLHLSLIDFDEIPVLLNHIKLFTGIHLILSTNIDIKKKEEILKNRFFDLNFEFSFIHRHFLLQLNDFQYEKDHMKNKLIELKQISKSKNHHVLLDVWGKNIYTNLLNIVEG